MSTILQPTTIRGRVAWLAFLPRLSKGIESDPVQRIELDWNGIAGDRHAGSTRLACARTRLQYPPGTEIRNVRQLALGSMEELAAVATDLGLDALDPSLLGYNLMFEGIPQFTRIPPASRLIFGSGASLAVDMENNPCFKPAKVIEARFPGHGKRFVDIARGRRGVTAWVERPGPIGLGDEAVLHVPPQRPYAPLAEDR